MTNASAKPDAPGSDAPGSDAPGPDDARPAPTPPPTRLAGGFALRRAGDTWIVDCPFPPPGWQIRQAGDPIRPDFPGTPLLYEDAYFEIVDLEFHEGRYRFSLAPWDDCNLLRGPQALDAESCRSLWNNEQERRTRESKARTLTFLLPLVGLLPADDQRKIEREYGLIAAHATLASAAPAMLVFLPLAFLGIIATFVPGFARAFPALAWTESWAGVLTYFALESWIRAHRAFIEDLPLGSFPVVLVVLVGRALGGLRGDT